VTGRWRDRERCFRVYNEAPGFRPGPGMSRGKLKEGQPRTRCLHRGTEADTDYQHPFGFNSINVLSL